MKKLILIAIVVVIGLSGVKAQDPSDKYLEKVSTMDNTLQTLYAVISGEKGEERNWELFKYLFHPEARLIPTGKNSEGLAKARFLTPDGYIEASGKWLVENGFFEKEIHRTVQSFGDITQVFSTYESFRSESDETPFMRGINSIQLLNDGNRWWVINIYWCQESPSNPIPGEFLPQ
ncbi:hypothetical protein [Poritiphilus flavus]|uniref:Nuclear transport factor 2 family protein n=1 Tax=Poritiphilus flavus TaxID=2697053 RepID=A0A6L9EEU1_9FLAO|nr:hypothetical protein [Poritiphilus flavus]NAS13173.1 hypothetical protein [Poritiphilus flavus]